jgi:sec-independent protein translocase protein TatA
MSAAPGLFALLPNLGPTEMLVVMGIAVLLFGKRLPEVGRSLGKGIVEFKKGLGGITEDLDLTSLTSTGTSSAHRYDEAPRSSSSASSSAGSSSSSHYTEASIPKFEPPAPAPAAPVQD